MKFTPEHQKENPDLNLLIVPVGTFACNCYISFSRKTRQALIIDPGDDAPYLEDIISDHELIPKIIIATHGHSDHVGAVQELRLAYNCLFAMNHKDSFLYREKIDIDLDTVKKIYGLRVISTPGHTPGSISLYDFDRKICFTGDIIFEGKLRGSTDKYYSDLLTLEKSIDKIKKLNKDIVIYPGHGGKFMSVVL
jgi:glyoxylase-like metal-dependent hydrolase (beta-lactamase superfamily II)